MGLLIHATIKVSGERAALDAFDARLKVLIAGDPIAGELSEHHGADELCYDLKVEGGIPFPVFAAASQEFPQLALNAEWVDPGAGARGAATIVSGKLTQHEAGDIATTARGLPVYIAATEAGVLTLALTYFRIGREEYQGYALTAAEDTVFRIARDAAGEVELFATEGAAEWSLAWRGAVAGGDFACTRLTPPVPIPQEDFHELGKLAQEFAAEWIWFAAGPREEIAIESERYARAGYTVSDANVRSARLHRMQRDGGFEHNALDADGAWVKDVVAACWPARPAR